MSEAGETVVLNLGMGVESSALLARVLLEPGCREGLGLGGPGGLSRMVVVTSMTGDEFPDTGKLVEEHLLPLLRVHGVRYVQLARAGAVKAGGRNVAVLDDSTLPARVRLEGRFRLSDEMLAAGTVPAMGGTKKCSIKAKGEVIDAWLQGELGNGARFSQMIGFNADEKKRKEDDLAAQAGRAADGFLPGRRGVFPLIDWGWDRARCLDYLRECFGVEWQKSACVYCLAGDTEVVTRDGIRPIRELAGRFHDILVPQATPVPSNPDKVALSGQGFFKNAEVRTYGTQTLYEVTLTRSGSVKVVLATAEHRWFVHGKRKNPRHKGSHPTTLEKTTAELAAGDRMRSLAASRHYQTTRVPFAVAQGFVYGDGSTGDDERPASLTIYDNGKDDALMPYFAAHDFRRTKSGHEVYGLPRTWKKLPDLRESRPFLVSWLAGYFAADGSVSKAGQAELTSASLESLRFARDVMAVCGIRHGTIQSKLRSGFGGPPTMLYRINIDARDVPEWFFLIREHAARIAARKDRRLDSERDWLVKSVKATGRQETVYCATVPGIGAFALADGLMTGNCPYSRGKAEVLGRYRQDPQSAAFALWVEHVALALNPRMALFAEKSLRQVLEKDGNAEALRLFREKLDGQREWAVYRVRRLYRSAGLADRMVEVLAEGGRAEMEAELRLLAAQAGAEAQEEAGSLRAWLRKKEPGVTKTAEEMLAVLPLVPEAKAARGWSEEKWEARVALPLAGAGLAGCGA